MEPGSVVDDRFEIEAEVARGGMGRVYRARDRHTDRPVALKTLLRLDDDLIARFRREVRVLAQLDHPGIVRYVAHGEWGEDPYLAMEWLDGVDLGTHFQSRLAPTATRAPTSTVGTTMAVSDALVLARRVASALGAIHARGAVHRDLKPSNLFLPGGDIAQVKVLDLGTVSVEATVHRLTVSGMLVGTPTYMAPEQVLAEQASGPPADVHALGVILYEALTGRRAFRASNLVAVLARVLLEEPPPVRELRPDVPEPLAALVTQMLQKAPARRPADGAALLASLEALAPFEETVLDPRPTAAALASMTLGAEERRVLCVAVAAHRGAGVAPPIDPQIVERCGGTLRRLADRSLLLTIDGVHTPTDRATRAARAALLLRHSAPTLAIAIATGRDAGERLPVGPVVDRATSALEEAAAGTIHLDDQTARLLEGRFELDHTRRGVRLLSEHETETGRTLLGRPTRIVGRRRELGTLTSTYDHCVEEPVACAVLVTADAGMGKSRLRSELLEALRRRGERPLVLEGHGDALSSGSPFGVLAPALRRTAGILDGTPIETARQRLRARVAQTVEPSDVERVSAFLGEMIGARFEAASLEALDAARKDAMLLAHGVQTAFEDWILAECEVSPVVLVLEDLHWGDAPSVRVVDGALRRARELPLMVVALARPDVHEALPGLFSRRGMSEIRLDRLSRRASAQLVRQVLGEVDEETVERVIDRADGNAFYLEELIRAVADGHGDALPETVLGMVQTRLDALGSEAKRLLRAASVFGEVFWDGGLRTLVGEQGAFKIDEWLVDLERQEIIGAQAESRFEGERQWRFRHALVRDAAYEMLTEDDRELGHRLAGAWLANIGEQDALALAEHFLRGGSRVAAVGWLQRAAQSSLDGNDLGGALRCVERAVDAGAADRTLGELRALESVAAYWESDYRRAAARGEEAAALLEEGSRELFRALGSAVVARARLADFEAVDSLFDRISSEAPDEGARSEQLISLCRATFQLIFAGRFDDADRALARITNLAGEESGLDPLSIGQLHHVLGVRAAHIGDVATFLSHLERAVDAFDRAGDLRNVSLERTTIAWCHAELGLFEEAERLCQANLARCEALMAQQAITYAKVNLGYILTHLPDRRPDARRVLNEAIAECRAVNNTRLEGWALTHLSALDHLEGRHRDEDDHAQKAARCLASSPGLEAWALASRARALLALDRPAEALALAERACATLRELDGLLQGESLPPLTLALARRALNAPDADAAARDAVERLARRADRLGRDDWRAAFLAIADNRAIQAL